MVGEIELQKLCADRLSGYLKASRFSDIQVGERTHIIKDCTFVPVSDGFTLFFGHAQADVALYKDAQDLTDQIDESANLKMYMNADNEFRIPLVVLEIKRGNITTDAIRSRSIIAREMNEIFPFIGYYFIADEVGNIMPRTIYRAGKHFDSFFLNQNTADKEWVRKTVIEDGISPHLDKLVSLGVLE